MKKKRLLSLGLLLVLVLSTILAACSSDKKDDEASNTNSGGSKKEKILVFGRGSLFAQSRIGTYPPFWALGCSPMQEHIDKLEFVAILIEAHISSITFAGTPAAITFAGISCVTTAPAAMIELSPIVNQVYTLHSEHIPYLRRYPDIVFFQNQYRYAQGKYP